MSIDDKQYLLSQQSPPWMSSSKNNANDTPEWVNRDEVDNFIQQARMMQQTPAAAGPREHVVPISFEKSPSKTPATPGFGPTPFYGAMQQQFNNVVSPKVGELSAKSRGEFRVEWIFYSPQIPTRINLSIKDTTRSTSTASQRLPLRETLLSRLHHSSNISHSSSSSRQLASGSSRFGLKARRRRHKIRLS